jgi:hypothetical protein
MTIIIHLSDGTKTAILLQTRAEDVAKTVGKSSLFRRMRKWLGRFWATVTLKNRYRPELHYMRGRPSDRHKDS